MIGWISRKNDGNLCMQVAVVFYRTVLCSTEQESIRSGVWRDPLHMQRCKAPRHKDIPRSRNDTTKTEIARSYSRPEAVESAAGVAAAPPEMPATESATGDRSVGAD